MKINKKPNKTTKEFIELLGELDQIELIGITKILCVKLVDDKGPRAGEDIILDIIDTFEHLNRKQKRDIFKILKEVKKTNAASKN